MKIAPIALASILSSFVANAGNVFYWRSQHVNEPSSAQGASAEFYDWASFGYFSNWSLERTSYNNKDFLVPSETDMIYSAGWRRTSAGASWTMGCFDLDGRSYTVGGFSLGTFPIAEQKNTFLYKSFVFGLTNGVLTIKNPNQLNYVSRNCQIWSGATLIYPSGVKVNVSYSNQNEFWTVKSGGRMNVFSGLSLVQLICTVEPGGTMYWDPDSLDVSQLFTSGKINTITNNGTFIAPNGIVWNGNDKSGSGKVKTLEVVQNAGTMTLGGVFTKTTVEYNIGAVMRFVLGGGKLVAERNVAFKNSVSKWGDEVSASMPDGASATVEVEEGATLDMGLFTYGEGASLVKTGPGTLVLAEMPDSLSVS